MVAGLEKPKVAPLRLVRRQKLPPAPSHLSAAMRSWWKRCVETFELDVHHLEQFRGERHE